MIDQEMRFSGVQLLEVASSVVEYCEFFLSLLACGDVRSSQPASQLVYLPVAGRLMQSKLTRSRGQILLPTPASNRSL